MERVGRATRLWSARPVRLRWPADESVWPGGFCRRAGLAQWTRAVRAAQSLVTVSARSNRSPGVGAAAAGCYPAVAWQQAARSRHFLQSKVLPTTPFPRFLVWAWRRWPEAIPAQPPPHRQVCMQRWHAVDRSKRKQFSIGNTSHPLSAPVIGQCTTSDASRDSAAKNVVCHPSH